MALLGALLGVNRERYGKAAGLRTHMLVAMGSVAFVIAPLFAGIPIADQSRVIQGVIAGIGFLGAGTIITHRNDEEVIGLTTAASVWMTAAIGVACGLGRASTASILAVLAWMVLSMVDRLSNIVRSNRRGNDEAPQTYAATLRCPTAITGAMGDHWYAAALRLTRLDGRCWCQTIV